MESLNEKILYLLDKLKEAMYIKQKRFSAIGYTKSIEKIKKYNKPINSLNDISHLFKPESSTMKHLSEYFDTGKISILDELKNDPITIFTKIYGVGPKKAMELKKQV